MTNETKCPVCKLNTAETSQYGVMPCNSCKEKRRENSLPNVQIEMVGNSIQEQRKKYYKDIIPPYRGETLSKEYVDAYGYKNIKPSTKDIKNMKNVWR